MSVNGGQSQEELQKKITEQADQIKKLAESVHTYQLKLQDVTTKSKALLNENNLLKANNKSPGGTDLVSELAKKDELLARMRREAKQVIDALKAKHTEATDALKAEHRRELDAARRAAGTAAAGGSGRNLNSDPASASGPTAHVAALTAEVTALKDKLEAAETKAAEADGLRAAKEEAEVSKEFLAADLATATAERDTWQGKAQEAEETLKRAREEAKRIVDRSRADVEQYKKGMDSAEQGRVALQEAMARLEADKAEQEQKRDGELRSMKQQLVEAQARGLEAAQSSNAAEQRRTAMEIDLSKRTDAVQAALAEAALAVQSLLAENATLRSQAAQTATISGKEAGEGAGGGAGGGGGLSEEVDALRLQLEEVAAQARAKQEEAAELLHAKEEELAGLLQRVTEREAEAEQLRGAVQEEKKAANQAQVQLKEERAERKKAEEELGNLQEECEKKNVQVKKVREEAVKLSNKSTSMIESLKKEKEDANKQLALLQETLDQERQQRQTLQDEHTASQQRVAELEESIFQGSLNAGQQGASDQEAAELKVAVADLEGRVASLQAEREAMAEKLRQSEEQIQSAKEEDVRKRDLLKRVKDEMDKMLAKREAELVDAHKQQLAQVTSEFQMQIEAAQAHVGQLESELSSLRAGEVASGEGASFAGEGQSFGGEEVNGAGVPFAALEELRAENSQLQQRLQSATMDLEMLRQQQPMPSPRQMQLQGDDERQEDIAEQGRQEGEGEELPDGSERLGQDGEWNNWQTVSAFANPAAPAAGAAGGPSTPQEQEEQEVNTEGAEYLEEPGMNRRQEGSLPESEQGEEELHNALHSIQRLAWQCTSERITRADLLRLLSHVEQLRPAVAAQWPAANGETAEAHSWEELSMMLFNIPSTTTSSSSSSSSSSPFLFCGVADMGAGLLTSAQHASKKCQQAETVLLQTFKRSARGTLPDSASDLEWMLLGQRNGLPTRMVDFFHSPLAALHAATLGADDKPAVVWCVDTRTCHRSCHTLKEWQDDRYADNRRQAARSAEHDAKALSVEEITDLLHFASAGQEEGGGGPAARGPRGGGGGEGGGALRMESLGDAVVFVEAPLEGEGGHPSRAGTGLLREQVVAVMSDGEQRLDEWLSRRPSGYRRVVIPARLKPQVRQGLDQAGFTERTLQPGLPGLCNWLRRRFS